MFCQFTNEPKVYTMSDEQKGIVFSNLRSKLERMNDGEAAKRIPMIGGLVAYSDLHNKNVSFDKVRIYTVDDELLESYSMVLSSSIENGERIEFLPIEPNCGCQHKHMMYTADMNKGTCQICGVSWSRDKGFESVKDVVMRLIAKIEGVSPTRVPYTYHHDYVRSKSTMSLSRADVVQKKSAMGTIYDLVTIANRLGYSYILWNDRVYSVQQNRPEATDTGLTIDDLL